MRVVKAKDVSHVPNFIGLLGAFITVPFGVLFEDLEIECGSCDTDFTIRFKTTDIRYAKCPACGCMNKWIE